VSFFMTQSERFCYLFGVVNYVATRIQKKVLAKQITNVILLPEFKRA